MMRLFEGHGMEVTHAERLPLHHGQLRVRVQRKGEGTAGRQRPARSLEAERAAGLDRLETWQEFARRTDRLKEDLHRTLAELRRRASAWCGYGAPAKGNTLLGFLGARSGEPRLHRRPQPAEAGSVHAGHPHPGRSDRAAAGGPARVRAAAGLELRRGGDGPAVGVPRHGGRFILPVPEVRFAPSTEEDR